MTSKNLPRHQELCAEGLAALGPRNLCDRESIHLSGAIQPHGLMLVVDSASLLVVAASANFPRLAGRGLRPLGAALGDVIGSEGAHAVLAMHATGNPHDALPTRIELPCDEPPGNRWYDMAAHWHGSALVLEFEAGCDTDMAELSPFFHRQRNTVKGLLNLHNVEEICQFTVQEVRQLTGYDRVMIYRFEPDAHGRVIAEARREDAEPFLGLHYPASDIPRQARLMYMRNWIRVIADAGYDPVPIVALRGGFAVEQLDLGMAVLRSVSPLHLQYLRNMGVGATMTISLIVDDQLWGMIACHHDSPKRVSHMQRLAYEALGLLVSVRLRAVDAAKHHEHVRDLGKMSAKVATAMAAAENLAAGAVVAAEALLGMVAADGAIVEIDGLRVSVGNVPSGDIVDRLVPHLTEVAGAGPGPLVTDALCNLLEMPADQTGLDWSAAAGALFLPLPGRVRGFILWLRSERARTVRWAGRPAPKPGDDGEAADVPLSPRASFAEWLEVVRGHSLPWRGWEVAAAVDLGHAMPEVLQHRSQNRLVRLALHDPLTGLPNRVQLHDRLDYLLGARGPPRGDSEPLLGILFMDVDGFKAVNDTLGHHAGDELLTMVARRISSLIRPQDIVARTGGDEFVLLLPDTGLPEAVSVGQRIVEDFRRPFLRDGAAQRSPTLSVGVSVVPRGTEPGEALRQADSAMYHAKRSGRDQVAVYDPAPGPAASRRKPAADQLRAAIDAGEITVHYQPILNVHAEAAGFIEGFEALARWQHPTRGLLSPVDFIGLAEESRLIDTLGDAVMLQALRQLRAWPDARLTMAVNVSVHQVLRPGFASNVLEQLAGLGIAPARLCLEITESQLMQQPMLALAALSELAEAGVRVAIDDFGIGFSSMSYLRDLPAAVLKIDRSFVSGLPLNRKDVAVVAGTIQLAHLLGMRTVAEGVETEGQLVKLRELGSDFVQGYLLGRPLPAEDVVLRYQPVAAHLSAAGQRLELASMA